MVEISALPEIIQQLPQLLFISDVVFYVFGVLFFGSLAIRGFRGYLNLPVMLGLRVLMGVISLVGGVALQGYFSFLNQGFYRLFRLDILAGSLVSSIVLAVGIYLLSFRFENLDGLRHKIERLKERLENAEKAPKSSVGWKDPYKIAGAAVLLGFIGFSLANFSGFPKIGESFLSYVGLSQEELMNLSDTIGDVYSNQLPQGCKNVIDILQVTGADITRLQEYSDPQITNLIESGANSKLLDLRIAVVEGEEHFLGITENQKICSARIDRFCSCVDLSEFAR